MKKNEIIVDGKVVNEGAFQEACRRYVGRNVIQCVSSLMYDIGQNLEECRRIFDFDYDDALGWFQRPDYETAAEYFIENADADDLETIADEFGYWSECVAAAKYYLELQGKLLHHYGIEYQDTGDISGDSESDEEYWAVSEAQAVKMFKSEPFADDKEITHIDVDTDHGEWFDAQPEGMDLLRAEVSKLVSTHEQYQWVCSEFNLDYDYDEVCEHWVVERWFAEELESRGYVVFEFGGMTIWGRMCTGQAILLDGVVREIVMGMGEHAFVWGD